MNLQPIEWRDDKLFLLDQRLLPEAVSFLECRTAEETALAIESLAVRGAPAIGIAAAYGVVLASVQGATAASRAICRLSGTRPTAVNLFWALRRMETALNLFSSMNTESPLSSFLLEEAVAIHREDIEINRAIGRHGQSLLPESSTILTHCNAGALATGGYGTALGIVRAAREAGKNIRVIADETRPVLQGARLTAWELNRDGFDVTLICDSMAGPAMAKFEVDAVITGADRVAANGDTANKIGTCSLAVLAAFHGIPFYIAAPISTLDLSTARGEDIPIEERPAAEVLAFQGKRSAPEGIKAWNPAFDVTPSRLITAFVTERGVVRPPFGENLRRMLV
ncbi:MAG: S-methyl-5-thioribose-1-phosphate isomerase [Synergistales bacterium]|jgi:methylthioribose-1-phosphate isomerase